MIIKIREILAVQNVLKQLINAVESVNNLEHIELAKLLKCCHRVTFWPA